MATTTTATAHKLCAVPELGQYEINVGALNQRHLGRTIAVRTGTAIVAGPLESINESAAYGKGRLVLCIRGGGSVGNLVVGLHPAHVVTILARDHTINVTISTGNTDAAVRKNP